MAERTQLPDALRAFVAEVIAARDAGGWNAVSWDALPTKLMCVVAELDELERALETDHAEAVAEELADVAIYLLIILHDVFDGWCARGGAVECSPHRHPAVLTRPVRRYAVGAFEAWRRGQRFDAQVACELALLEAARLAHALCVDLCRAVGAKTAKNRARAPRHGGKHPDS